MFDDISLPQDWTRNRGLEVRLVRPLCLEHESLTAFIDIAPPENTEGPYEWPEAIAVAKLYLEHERLEGFVCRGQRPIFDEASAERVVEKLATAFKTKTASSW